jgi:hypothetical protein
LKALLEISPQPIEQVLGHLSEEFGLRAEVLEQCSLTQPGLLHHSSGGKPGKAVFDKGVKSGLQDDRPS